MCSCDGCLICSSCKESGEVLSIYEYDVNHFINCRLRMVLILWPTVVRSCDLCNIPMSNSKIIALCLPGTATFAT